ncbi:GSCFA domain-containing protein [Winogradskyella poriferorum]|uniref:GSCFA domain-containing protein n=1 Tax=Winogradskyella poriferorum TaxID=307627 RepID=UPI003D65468F
MKLQTKIPLEPQSHHQIDYDSRILLIGSCFSENIGGKFEYYKFQSSVNPLGILFNPLAIENLISRAINLEYYQDNELINAIDSWVCLDAHSSLNTTKKSDLIVRLNTALDATHQQLKTVSHVIITLGTSWVYRFLQTDKIVANCHKIPQKQFLKELLDVDSITESLQAIIALLKAENSRVNILFTVSPVRHLKDGFVENMRSKAHLITAVQNCVDPRERINYFPSYELMMDELRDYRFYKSDMIHPNDLALDYIWEKFKTTWISKDTENVLKSVDQIQKKLAHKPFNKDSQSYQDFRDKLAEEIKKLEKIHPNISF